MTTNPSLIAKSNIKVEDVIKEILTIIDEPISCEVNESDYLPNEVNTGAKLIEEINISSGKHLLRFVYQGKGKMSFYKFNLI